MSTSSDVSGDDISQKVSDSKIELFFAVLVCIYLYLFLGCEASIVSPDVT